MQEILKKLFNTTKQMSAKEDKNLATLKELFYKCSRCVFCARFQYKKDNIKHDLYFPGNHDFNICLSRFFEDALTFYVEWLDTFSVFVESNGQIYPRYIPEIRQRKRDDGSQFMVFYDVLLAKKDIPDIEEVEKCLLPHYYSIPDENISYGTLEQEEKLFKRCLGAQWEMGFERYKIVECPINQELQRNTDKYKNLPKTLK